MEGLTDVTEKTIEVVVTAENETGVAEPSFASDGTATVDPSEKVKSPPVTYKKR